MSRKERQRLVIMQQVECGDISLKEAAFKMGVSVRQAIRIRARFRKHGDEGLIHRARNKRSNKACEPAFKQQVLSVYQERYSDFGPTLACEKMAEYEELFVNRETLRRWLIQGCLWRVGEKQRIHRRKRRRKERFGEMLQIDGSEHDWFEGRGPRCVLLVIIDDATGKMALHMAEAETKIDALIVLKKWVKRHGVPVSIYADRRTVYFTENFIFYPAKRSDPKVFTDFMRVTDRLGIEMIPAYSPQAKGRVERANGLLQDRLVKEFRLRGIDTIDDANAMLDSFALEMEQRFAKDPLDPADAHRMAPKGRDEWDYFFCFEKTRTVQKDNTVVIDREQWQILEQEGGPRPKHKVTYRIPVGASDPYWLYNGKRLSVEYLGRVSG